MDDNVTKLNLSKSSSDVQLPTKFPPKDEVLTRPFNFGENNMGILGEDLGELTGVLCVLDANNLMLGATTKLSIGDVSKVVCAIDDVNGILGDELLYFFIFTSYTTNFEFYYIHPFFINTSVFDI